MNFDTENENFENILFNLFDSQKKEKKKKKKKKICDENNDPDINFFNEKSEAINLPY